MMKSIRILAFFALLPFVVFAAGKPLPRGLDALGIGILVNLDMAANDLEKVNGKVTKSGKFVVIEASGGHVASMIWNGSGDRVVKISARLPKDKCGNLIKELQDFSEGNQSERERVDRNEIHTWKDGKTEIRVVSTEDFCRVDLTNFEGSKD